MPSRSKKLSRLAELDVRPVGVGRLADTIGVRMRRVDRYLTAAALNWAAARKLQSGVPAALSMIVEHPGISQNEVAQLTGWDKSRVVGIIDALEGLGWAVRRTSENDLRRRLLYATSRGKSQLEDLVKTVKKEEMAMLAAIPEEDLEAVMTLLDRMHESCLDYIQHPPNQRRRKR